VILLEKGGYMDIEDFIIIWWGIIGSVIYSLLLLRIIEIFKRRY